MPKVSSCVASMNYSEWRDEELKEVRLSLLEKGFVPDAAQHFSELIAYLMNSAREYTDEHEN